MKIKKPKQLQFMPVYSIMSLRSLSINRLKKNQNAFMAPSTPLLTVSGGPINVSSSHYQVGFPGL